jgi:hypothetical protein
MNERADATVNTESIESLIESQDINQPHEYINPNGKVPPTFYTMLLFHRAFCKYTFDDTFDFMLKDDPYYGKNTFGQVARLMPERAYVVHQRMKQLKDGGWKDVTLNIKEDNMMAI